MARFTSIICILVLSTLTTMAFAQEAEDRDPVVNEDATEAKPAADEEVVVWQVQGDGSASFSKALGDALGENRRNHILSRTEAAKRLQKGSASDVLGCFKGVEPCLSPTSVAIDAMGGTTLIRVSLAPGAATYSLVDRRGQTTRNDTVKAGTPRDLAFAVVGAVFDATATVAFESEPAGATVFLGEAAIGTTPMSHRIEIGTYNYSFKLADHQEVRAEMTVGSGQSPVIRHELKTLYGMLVVSDAPDGAEVFLNDKLVGNAGDPLEVEPGTYSLEVRAAGYEPIQDAITITPGGTVTRAAAMNQENLLDLELTEEQIVVNNYLLRVGYEAAFQSTTLLDARTDEDLPLEFLGFTENGALPSDAILRKTLQTNSLRLDASYAFRNFGIVLASITYGSGSAEHEGVLVSRDGTIVEATITNFTRFHLRPFQLFWRAIYGNWVPSVELGTGIVFNWYDAVRDDTGEIETLRRTDATWTLGIAAQYYVTPNFFGNVRYSLQGYFDDSVGADHMLSLSLGVALPNLFGFEPEPPDTLGAEE